MAQKPNFTLRSDDLDEAQMAVDEATVRHGFWPKFRGLVGQLPFAEDLLAAYYCALDPATPRTTKAVLLGALAYFVVPLDLVPDFLVLVGYGDDAAILYAAYRMVAKQVTPQHHDKARDLLAQPANQ